MDPGETVDKPLVYEAGWGRITQLNSSHSQGVCREEADLCYGFL